MELRLASSTILLNPLQAVMGVVERRHTLPILANVLIQTRNTVLEVIATDLEIEISACTNVDQLEDSQAITLNAKKLSDLLRALPSDCPIKLVANENRLILQAERSRYQLQTMPVIDYPRVALGNPVADTIVVTQKTLKQLLHRTEFAMANQDIRFYLNGLLLILRENQLIAVATDGHRLAYASANITFEQVPQDLIIPRKTVLELSRLLVDSDDVVTIAFLGNQVRFTFANIILTSKVIDGKFPDFQKVIPAEHAKHITVSRQLILQTLQRAAILANEKFRGVRLVLTHQSLKIICSNAEQEEAEEELVIDYQGESLDIGFNIAYLLDVLNNITMPDLVFSFGDAASSALVTIPGQADFKYVVMPMRI